jgi:hypothetical protein
MLGFYGQPAGALLRRGGILGRSAVSSLAAAVARLANIEGGSVVPAA